MEEKSMNLKIFQHGFNYSQDGAGNRLIFHLQGCNMHCPWCSNPEGMRPEGVLMTDPDYLKEGLCPHDAVHGDTLDRTQCKACPDRLCLTPRYRSKGIHLSYEEMSVADVVSYTLSCKPMFYDGGGVTFTGGEATLQFEPLKEVLKQLTEAGIHTAIETNGSHPRLPELFPYLDQIMMDCKHWDPKQHQAYTGVSLDAVWKNTQAAAQSGKQLDIRIPLIGGVNDRETDMQNFVKKLQEINNEHVTVEVLKYHEFGKSKWADCGFTYTMTEAANVTTEQIRHFRDLLIEGGLTYKQS